MHTVPYDFIDRVFTKLDATNHKKIKIQSPLWMEAARVYKKKLQVVDIRFVEQTCNYHLSAEGRQHGQTRCGFTFDELVHMDDRFIKVDNLIVAKNLDDYHGVHNDVSLTDLIGFISRFPVREITISGRCQEVIDECLKTGLQPKALDLEYCPETEAFLKHHIGAGGTVQKLTLFGDKWPLKIKNDVVDFVSRPTFKFLECDIEIMDTKCLKKIIAYWRSMENPWKSARISVTGRRLSKSINFDALSLTLIGTGRFRQERGEHCLLVKCRTTKCKFLFGVTSELIKSHKR